MNHKAVKRWELLSLLMSIIVYADSKPQIRSNHIASLYLPKRSQPLVQYPVDQHLQQHQPQHLQQPIQHYQVLHLAQPNYINQDVQKSQISTNASTNWGDPLMRMLSTNVNVAAPTKSASPLDMIVSGMKLFTSILSGDTANTGIMKVDKLSPMQKFVAALFSELASISPEKMIIMARDLINIEINLMDILKKSFLQQPLASNQKVSDLGIASIAMLKGLVKTTISPSEKCMEKYMCEANTECKNDIDGGNSVYCQLGSYATSFVLQLTTGKAFDKFYEAGRRGRQGESCQEIYVECNK